MKYIVLYEKHGVVNDLREITDFLWDKIEPYIEEKSKLKIAFEYLGHDGILELVPQSSKISGKYGGYHRPDEETIGSLHKIKMYYPYRKSTLYHELKHMDYFIRNIHYMNRKEEDELELPPIGKDKSTLGQIWSLLRGSDNGNYYFHGDDVESVKSKIKSEYIKSKYYDDEPIIQKPSIELKHLNKNTVRLLKYITYIFNPNEFQSILHDIYHEISEYKNETGGKWNIMPYAKEKILKDRRAQYYFEGEFKFSNWISNRKELERAFQYLAERYYMFENINPKFAKILEKKNINGAIKYTESLIEHYRKKHVKKLAKMLSFFVKST